MTAKADFVHLHVHSEYSLLDGAARLERARRAGRRARLPGHRADRPRQPLRQRSTSTRHARSRRHQADPRLRALRRARAAASSAPRSGRQLRGREPRAPSSSGTRRATRNLIKLVSKAYLEGFYYKPRVDQELLAQHADGLLVLSGCLNSEVSPPAPRRGRGQGARDGGLVPGGLRQGPLLHGGPGARPRGADAGHRGDHPHRPRHRRAARAAPTTRTTSRRRTRAPTRRCSASRPGTNDEPTRTGGVLHRGVLSQVGRGDARGLRGPARGLHEHPGRGRALQPRARPSASSTCRGTRCRPGYTLDSYLERAGRRGPPPALRPDAGRRRGRARSATSSASSRRWGSPATSWSSGTSSRYARRQGIAVGPGRGSSAGSLVAYCLGITNVDPMRYGLLFERFLNPERDLHARHGHRLRRRPPRRGHQLRRRALRRATASPTSSRSGPWAPRRSSATSARVLGLRLRRRRPIAKLVPDFPLNITLDEALEKAPPLAEQVKREPRGGGALGSGQARSRAAPATPRCTPRRW